MSDNSESDAIKDPHYKEWWDDKNISKDDKAKWQ